MQTNIDPLAPPTKAPRIYGYTPEYRLLRCNDSPLTTWICDTPERIANFWTSVIQGPDFDRDRESMYCLHLNCRRRVQGYHLISHGLLDTLLAHPREVFRVPIVTCAAAIIVIHNHPSGDPTPSEADIKVTRDLIRAGQLLKIELVDHVVIGLSTPERPKAYESLRELGYFYC